jgi:hypothetical protein
MASSTADYAHAALKLEQAPAYAFAQLIDYLRDVRDCAYAATETSKLEFYAQVQTYLDQLTSAKIAVVYSVRETSILGKDWPNQTPMPVTLVYIVAFSSSDVPKSIIVPKKIAFNV